MRSSGVLLKPSEKITPRKNDQNKPQISSSVNKPRSRFEHLKQIVRSGLQTAFEVGAALLEIRDTELYKHEFPTFEAFCESEFKIVRSRAYQLIEAAQIKEALPPDLSKILDNDAQARALASVPTEQRTEVIERVVDRGPVTAKAIKEVAGELSHPSRWTNLPNDVQKQVKSGQMSVGQANALYDSQRRQEEAKENKQQKEEQHLDKTGYVIPESILEDWRLAESFKSTLNDLQRIKLQVEKAIDNKVPIYRFADQSAVIDLQNAWRTLQQILPYAVCPTCQGRTRSKCSACKGMGYVPEFGYKHWFAKEVIELREKAIKK